MSDSTAHPIDTEALREHLRRLIDASAGPGNPTVSIGDLRALLDALAAAEHRATRAEARIKAVRDVHQPLDALHTNTGRVRQVCTGCDTDGGNWRVWPCPTIRALTA